MKLIEANRAKECASTLFTDPILKMSVNAVLDNAPGFELVRCKDCCFSAQHDPYDPMECMKWTTKWGVAYTTPDGHCHKGERRTDA